MRTRADRIEKLALRLARESGHRAEPYQLAVKATDLAEWFDIVPDKQTKFVCVCCAECNRIWSE
jgi:hypothetical protein